MFGFQGGESAETLARKKGYRRDAQERWTFLTNFDLSTDQDRGPACLGGQGSFGPAPV